MKTPLVRTALFHAPAGVPRWQSLLSQRPGRGSGTGLATRQAVDVLLDGASGAGSLLLNTKASQEAACSRAPAAIVPGQKPESRDTGVSLFAENGSHLAEADAAEGHAGHVDDPGSSGNAGNGSHLARADGADAVARQDGNPGSSGFHETGSHLAGAGAAEGLAGGVPPGVNENGRVGRWDFGKGKARAALSARKSRQRYMAICPVKTAFLRTKLCS